MIPLQRNTQLDGIRGLAIVLIIFWHYGNNQLIENNSAVAHHFKLISAYMWSGVDLFFILSGFLLGGILLNHRASPAYFRTFYIRRICRIFPLYYLSLLILLFIIYSGYGQATEWGKNNNIPHWSYFIFSQNIFMGIKETLGNRWLTHTWSLALEEQFYLVLPLLIYAFNKRTLAIILCVCILSAPFFRYFSDNWYEAFNFLHCRFDALFSGVILALIIREERLVQKIKKVRVFLFILFILLLIGLILFSIHKFSIPYALENTWITAMYSLLILLVLTNGDNFLANFFSHPILVKTGIISYALYLFHQPISGLIHYFLFHKAPQIHTLTELAATFMALLLSFSLALLSYSYIEKPIISYGHRHTY